MEIKCTICDQKDKLDHESILAKRLRNRPTRSYLCNECYERITINTKKRISTGNFKLYKEEVKDKWYE